MNDKTIKAVAAMLCLTVVFAVNTITHGPNGLVAATLITAIAGLGGWVIGRKDGA